MQLIMNSSLVTFSQYVGGVTALADGLTSEFTTTDSTTTVAESVAPTGVSATPLGDLILNIIFVIVGTIGSTGNALVIIVLGAAVVRKENTTNYLILNQACVDFGTSFQLIFIYSINNEYVPESGLWAEFLCRFWLPHTLLWTMFVVSTYNLVMMCTERFIAVTFPVLYSTKLKKKAAWFMIAFAWIIAPLIHFYYPIWFDYNDNGVCQKNFALPSLGPMGYIIIFWEFFLPFTLMSIMYTTIVLMLRKKQNKVGGEIKANGNQVNTVSAPQQTGVTPKPPAKKTKQLSHQVRRNVTVTLFAVFIMFGLCWMPNHMTFLFFSLGFARLNTPWHKFTLFLAYMNMSINPVIYAWKYRQFQDGFRRLFCRKNGGDSLLDSTATGPGTSNDQRHPVFSSRAAKPNGQQNDLLTNTTNA